MSVLCKIEFPAFKALCGSFLTFFLQLRFLWNSLLLQIIVSKSFVAYFHICKTNRVWDVLWLLLSVEINLLATLIWFLLVSKFVNLWHSLKDVFVWINCLQQKQLADFYLLFHFNQTYIWHFWIDNIKRFK